MKYVTTIIGSAICGALVFGIWPEMWKSYGIMGGWLAATIVISITWFMNHWLGTIRNPDGRIWVDQGWAVGSSGTAWAVVRFGADFVEAMPTLILCLIGGALGGIAAAAAKNHISGWQPDESSAPEGS